MFRFIIKFFSVMFFIVAKIIVLGISIFALPIVLLYASHLNAKEPIKIKNTPDFIAIPVPVRSINKGTVISESDLSLQDVSPNLANSMIAQDTLQLVGQEARRTLYKNKPILLRDIGAVTIVRRNDTVTMIFKNGAMELRTIGRAMQDGGHGDLVKVMNEHSKKIVTGHITQNGEVDVSL